MKKLLFPLLALLAAGPLLAQTPTEDYLRRYNNLVARVGVSGVGVEPLLDKWAADWPDDTNQLLARFYFCFDRCHSAQVIQLDQEKYLGREPILPLKDSLGVVHNYFEDTLYDDALYAASEQALDRILALHPERLDIRLLKISALTQYEKGSPDMALAALKSLVAKHYKEGPHPGPVLHLLPPGDGCLLGSLPGPFGGNAPLPEGRAPVPEQPGILLFCL